MLKIFYLLYFLLQVYKFYEEQVYQHIFMYVSINIYHHFKRSKIKMYFLQNELQNNTWALPIQQFCSAH